VTDMTRRTKIAWIVGFVVLALVGSGVFFATRRTPQTLEYIIPKGTATQLLLGEPINIMPDRIDLSVGDRLIIRNRDVVNHTVGPYTMRPGESIDVTYRRVGRFTGICTVNANSDTVITIR
jgi:plastocyanin